MTVLMWMFAVPLIAWMAAAGLGTLAGAKMAVQTFDRLGYSPRARALAGVGEVLMAVGILVGAVFADDPLSVAGIISANAITGLTWFVIGGRGASRTDKAGAWAVTILATGYLVALML